MGFMGFAAILAGLWFIDSAVQGRGPISSLKGILSSPAGTSGADPSSYDGTATPVVNVTAGLGGTDDDSTQSSTSADLGGTDDDSTQSSASDNLARSTADSGSDGSAAAGAVAFALAQVGKPYQYGATGPNSYDCSGLCYKAYQSVGVTIGRDTALQIQDGTEATQPLRVGDLVFPDLGHVEMYIGNNQTVQAPHTGAFIFVGPVPTYIAARRVA
jgi:cell wall-associated NlpC family hydrolase